DVDLELFPRQCARVPLGERAQPVLADYQLLAFDPDLVRQPAEDGVVLEQVGEHARIAEVIERDHLDVGSRMGQRRAEEATAYPAESIDSYPNSHERISSPGVRPTTSRPYRAGSAGPAGRVDPASRCRPAGPRRGPARAYQWRRSKRRPDRRPALPRVPGLPSSPARLSAIASSRRIRPATASFVSGGSERAPSSSRLACLCSIRSRPAPAGWSGTPAPRISSAPAPRA